MHTIKLPEAKGISTATVARWHCRKGESVAEGDLLVTLDTEYALIEVNAPAVGTLGEIHAKPGTTLAPGDPLATLDPDSTPPDAPAAGAPKMAEPDSTPVADNVTPLLMPKAGNTMEEGTIIEWKVAEGETISEGDVIAEIETDKANVEIEADHAGRLARIVAQAGEIVEVQGPIAYLADDDAAVDAYLSAHGEMPAVESSPEPEQAAARKAGEGPQGDVTPLLLPKQGNTMEEGTIIEWKVAEGDTISVGEVLYEVETDKATVEVEAEHAGRLARIVAPAGETVPVKAPVAYLADNDADVDAYIAAQPAGTTPEKKPKPAPAAKPASKAPAKPTRRPTSQPARRATPAGGLPEGMTRTPASPAARKLARQRGLDVATLYPGSGPNGRVLSDDVAAAPAATAGASADKTIEPAPATTGPVGETIAEPLTKMRRAIARNLQVSKQTVPHFYMTMAVQADALMNYYRARKAQFKVSVNDVVTLAVGRALAEFPEMRSRIDEDAGEIVTAPAANIGIAVGTDDGLTVPVLLDADRMDLRTLADKTRRIVSAARDGQLEGVGQGVFTITNLGMFGVDEFSAIINPPEAGILAVGAVKEDVIVENGAMRPGRVMKMTLAADHRVVDGLLAAKFLARLKELLEQPQACE
ncbi:MAG: 2-oxo acid dehydrogenase subunit E2 [Phycisphaerae bacterium]